MTAAELLAELSKLPNPDRIQIRVLDCDGIEIGLVDRLERGSSGFAVELSVDRSVGWPHECEY